MGAHFGTPKALTELEEMINTSVEVESDNAE